MRLAVEHDASKTGQREGHMHANSKVFVVAAATLAAALSPALAEEPELRGAFPTIVITRAQLLTSGQPTVGDYLQALPMQGDALNAQTVGEGSGAVTVNLRALGPGRTLVLVNGRRMASGGGLLATTQQVDLYAIPLFTVEQLEILDGVGSTAYGSEAMAGVVNVITRRAFSGTEAAVSTGLSDRRDGGTLEVSALTGQQGERRSWTLGVGYARQGEVLAGSRGWSGTGYRYDAATGQVVPAPDSIGTPAGTFQLDPSTCATAACAALVAGHGAGSRRWTIDPSLPGGARPYAAADAYDFTALRTLSMPSERFSASAAGEVNLGQGVTGSLEFAFTNRQSSQQLAPLNLNMSAHGAPDGTGYSGQNAYNPYGVDLPILNRRMTELGPRVERYDFDTVGLAAGLKGTLQAWAGPLHGWAWEAGLEYGRTVGSTTFEGDLRLSPLWDAIGPTFSSGGSGGAGTCGTPAAPIFPCTPLDLFAGPGAIPSEQLAGITFTGVDRTWTQLRRLALGLRGELPAPQPGHPAALSIGAEVRDQSASYRPDALMATGDTSRAAGPAVSGSYAAQELHAELLLPIWSGAPGLERLDLTAGGRVFHYSTFGTDASWLLGIRYAPARWVTVRAGASTSYRAPDVEALYRPSQTSFPSMSDPCARHFGAPLDATSGLYAQCNASGVAQGAGAGATANNGDDRSKLRVQEGGNPKLQPEAGRRLGAGLVVEPAEGLWFTLDWSSLRVERAINEVSAASMLQACYTASPDPGTASTATRPQRYCDAIRRTEFGYILEIDAPLQNHGTIRVTALDLSGRSALPTPAGRFELAVDGSWLITHDVTLPDGSVTQRAGEGDGATTLPALKVNARASWGRGALGAGAGLRWVAGYRECQSDRCAPDRATGMPPAYRDVAPWAALDLHASWSPTSAWGTTTVVAGVNNAFDEAPPISSRGLYPADPSTYDFQGRRWFLRVAQAF